MNIDAAAASAMTQAKLGDQVSIRVAKMAMDQSKVQGEAAVKLIKDAAQNVPTDNGLGGALDLAA